MKNILYLMIAITGSLFATEQDLTLTVNVKELRNSVGVVQFSLYNHDGTIPDEKFVKYFKQKTSVIKNNKASVTFTNLPKGAYAINILHDENQDGKILKGFVFPKEGIGFSQFDSIGIRTKPSYNKASFQLRSHKNISINIIYF